MNGKEQMLFDFVAGRLEPEAHERFAALVATDPNLAQRVVRQQLLQRAARQSFEEDLVEPVPDAWVAQIDQALPGATTGKVESLAALRVRRKLGWPKWQTGAAVAASLALGLYIGGSGKPPGEFGQGDGVLLASAPLSAALDTAPSGVPVELAGNRVFDVQLSLRDGAGRYCREAAIRGETGREEHLLACKEQSGWRIVGFAQADSPQEGYETAEGEKPLDTLISSIGGAPLDAQAEQKAIEQKWFD